uniref:hypothetical protein n=1 Tax=Acetatifactor sp. TaxID=1872090 RepID=UPI00405781D8
MEEMMAFTEANPQVNELLNGYEKENVLLSGNAHGRGRFAIKFPVLESVLEERFWEAVYSKEEAAGYFDGQKSAEEAARIIQNRVQLYIDERL